MSIGLVLCLVLVFFVVCVVFFFFKQKTAYEIYQCDWSSDVCSSDLRECEGLYRAIGTAMNMTWHVLELEVGPAGQVRSSEAGDLMAEIKRAAFLV